MTPAQRKAFQKHLGHRFRDPSLLLAALTHPSRRNENPENEPRDNQRLEFLGDAVLGLLAAETLYALPDHYDEGTMTRLRSLVTSRPALAEIGRDWQLGEWLRFGRGERDSGGADRDSNLADAVEALIGAVYRDGGHKACRKLFQHHILPRLDRAREKTVHNAHSGNPKGALQEWTQAAFQRSPDYAIVDERGPAHDREYIAAVLWDGEEIARGTGPGKRAAEAEAAARALPALQSRFSARTSSSQGTSS